MGTEGQFFKIRGSATYDICGGEIGLTEKQEVRLSELQARTQPGAKPLTLNMEAELIDLVYKRDNPELPKGAQTYCKQWLKEYRYKRRKEIKSKYITKGNHTEEDGFTLACLQLKLGMVYKNKEQLENDFCCGTPDLRVKKVVYDNKSSWDLSTFPMFETHIPDTAYWWQLQTYMDLENAENAVLCYTLIDAPEFLFLQEIRYIEDDNERYEIAKQMFFTTKNFELMKSAHFPTATATDFIEIPDDQRVKKFDVQRDQKAIDKIHARVLMCREYINTLN